MTRAVVALTAMVLAGPALAAEPPLRFATPYASPSSVISAEIAVSQAAQAKGRGMALRDAAADNAIVFAPDRVLARDWLKTHAGPAGWKRAPLVVWMSCDGSYAVSRGAWQSSGPGGAFVSLWQRQPKSGAYKWLLTVEQSASAGGAQPATAAGEQPDMITGKVATCRPRGAGAPPGMQPAGSPPVGRPPGGKQKPRLLQPDIDPAAGRSDDGSLTWCATASASGEVAFTASAWNGSAYAEVLALAPGAPGR